MSAVIGPTGAEQHDLRPVVGDGPYRYELVEDWAQLPEGWVVEQTAVVTDAEDRVYLFMRGDHPLVVLGRDGTFVDSWDGNGLLTSAHGMGIDADGNLYLPVFVSSVVYKFSPEGELMLTLGTRDEPSDTDWPGGWRNVPGRAGGPFNTPCDVHVTSDGAIWVADGYGNTRIHRFSHDGELELSFGEPGSGPGQFHAVHGLWVHEDGRVYVADRENNRVQIFDRDGTFLDQWAGLARPCDIVVDADGLLYLAEVDDFVTVRTLEGEVLSRWENGNPPGSRAWTGAHALWVDSQGDVYVNVNVDGHRLEKYRLVPAN